MGYKNELGFDEGGNFDHISIVKEATDEMIQAERQMLDRELLTLLSKYNLPLDKEAIRKAGYEVITDIIVPPEVMGVTTYKFRILKILEEKTISFKHDINII